MFKKSLHITLLHLLLIVKCKSLKNHKLLYIMFRFITICLCININ